MDSQLWRQINELFQAAVEFGASERAAFLDRRCQDDSELRHQVERLLASREPAGTFLDTPSYAVVGEMAAAELAGRVIQTYSVISRIGTGGMGEVYLARDRKLDRPVAIKFLSSAVTIDRDRLRRFHAEARAISALNHPNILVIHDFGEFDGRPFMVTEFVEGQTLRQRLADGALASGEGLE